MTLLIVYLFVAIGISFLCSIMEAVLLSAPLPFLKAREESGKPGYTRFIKLKTNIDKPLSAILSLNTVAHTVGAAGVGAQAVYVFGEAYFGIISAVLTIVILIFSEIIPKTIGARFWRELVIPSGYIIRSMIVVTYPLVLVAAVITRAFQRDTKEVTTSREEISALATIGTAEGIFAEEENRIIQNLIRLRDIRVSEIITPRVVLATADENMPVTEFLKNKAFLHYSRIPVYMTSTDNVTGYVLRQEVFERMTGDHENLTLKEIRREIVIVPDSMTILRAWDKLLTAKEHIALVVDEYGGVDGIVTMEDIIETLLGFEIMDEKDMITDMQQYAKERWKMRQLKYNLLDNS
jgi:CBS domain containing-hemolysin-like protein